MIKADAGRQQVSSRLRSSNSKKKNSGAALRSGILIVLMLGLVIGYYYYLSNRSKAEEETVPKITAVQEILARDLDRNYPPTVKEVVRYYSDLMKCMYNETYTDEELEQMASKARALYDDRLLENNDWSKYIIDLQDDIKEFKDINIRISSYILPASTDVDTFTLDDGEFARFYCTYVLSSKQRIEEVYLLRKDEDGHWRIFGWDLAENVVVPAN